MGLPQVFSDDEDNFDAGDVAEPGMNGVCARPIGPSDLLYGGTTTYCIVAMYGSVAHFSLVVWGGQRGDSQGCHFNRASSPSGRAIIIIFIIFIGTTTVLAISTIS